MNRRDVISGVDLAYAGPRKQLLDGDHDPPHEWAFLRGHTGTCPAVDAMYFVSYTWNSMLRSGLLANVAMTIIVV